MLVIIITFNCYSVGGIIDQLQAARASQEVASKNRSSGNAQASSSLESLHLVAAAGSFDTVKYQSPLETVYVDNEIRKNFQGTRDGTRNVAGADRRTKCRRADEDDDGR